MIENTPDTQLLAQLIGQKHDVLVQLRDLSRRQVDMIGVGDMSRLLTVLSAKQSLLNQLQAVERRLDPFRNQDPDSRIWHSPAEREQCRQTAARCEALLSEILLVEKHSESDLIARRDRAAERLQGTHRAAEARTAYAQTRPAASRQLDLTE